MTKLEHALDAASRGLRVFPQAGKRPSIKRWPDNASKDPEVITRWWRKCPDADIGIALDPDVYVLDADNENAHDWLGSYVVAEAPTLTIATARGMHAYYRVPHELARKTPVPAAMDFACVEGKGSPGPVTWAGSIHSTGVAYQIMHDLAIAEMPGELVRAIGPRRSTRENGEATDVERAEWARRASACEQEAQAPGMARFALGDAQADLHLTLRALRYDLPHMPTGWADRAFRAGAYLGPHIASGGLSLDYAAKELADLFMDLDEQGDNPEHVLRSIDRGLATGARSAQS